MSDGQAYHGRQAADLSADDGTGQWLAFWNDGRPVVDVLETFDKMLFRLHEQYRVPWPVLVLFAGVCGQANEALDQGRSWPALPDDATLDKLQAIFTPQRGRL